jgi:hypothetical protein
MTINGKTNHYFSPLNRTKDVFNELLGETRPLIDTDFVYDQIYNAFTGTNPIFAPAGDGEKLYFADVDAQGNITTVYADSLGHTYIYNQDSSDADSVYTRTHLAIKFEDNRPVSAANRDTGASYASINYDNPNKIVITKGENESTLNYNSSDRLISIKRKSPDSESEVNFKYDDKGILIASIETSKVTVKSPDGKEHTVQTSSAGAGLPCWSHLNSFPSASCMV